MSRTVSNGTVEIGGACLDYARMGRGERALAVLPGLSDGLATVRGKARFLTAPYRQYFDDWTVYMFSRRRALPAGFTMEDMAADQARALRALGLDRACVLGVSQGGMIAQLLAAAEPQLVDRLVLAFTAPGANETVRGCVGRWVELARRGAHRELMIDTAEHSYSAARLRSYRRYYPFLGLVGRPKSYDRFFVNAEAILSFGASDAPERIACPTLILGGTDDRIVGPDASRELHGRIAGSELYMYEGLGHAAYEEAGDFYERVFAFLDA